MRRPGPRPLAVAIEAVTAELTPGTLLAAVQAAWPAAAGEVFAAATRPVGERDGVVTVACEAAVYAQELDLLSERVIERLNACLGRAAVRRLRPQVRPLN